MSDMMVTRVIKCFMTGFEDYSTGGNSFHVWYCKPDQKSMVREVTGPRGKPTTVAMLNGHAVKTAF